MPEPTSDTARATASERSTTRRRRLAVVLLGVALLGAVPLAATAGPTSRTPKPGKRAVPAASGDATAPAVAAGQPAAGTGDGAAADAGVGAPTAAAKPAAPFAVDVVKDAEGHAKLSGPEHLSISIDDAYQVVDVGVAPRDLYDDGVTPPPANPFTFGQETFELETGAVVVTSSSRRQWEGEGLPTVLFDGDLKTRWSSDYLDKQTLQFKLKSPVSKSSIKLYWEIAAAKDYLVSVSSDGVRWMFVGERQGLPAGPRTDTVDLPDGTQYVRLNLETRTSAWGFSLYEIQVVATPPPPAPAPPADGTPAEVAPGTAPAEATPAPPAGADQVGKAN